MNEKKQHLPRILTTLMPYIIMLAIVILLRMFVIGSFNIPSASMENTLKTGDITLVNYLNKDHQKGDILVFADDNGWLPDNGRTQYIVKRFIADEGDTIRAEHGTVYVNNKPVKEPYTLGYTNDFPETTVPQGSMFMMGDNRENSGDSRYFMGTGKEFISKESIKGEPFTAVTFSPFNIRAPK